MATTFTYLKTVSMTSCATTLDSPNLTVLASADGSWGVALGAVVAHANIPVGTTIIDYTTTTNAVMSANATATGSGLTVVATNPTNINIDAIDNVIKTGGDIYNISGPTFTIDQHSRFGLNNGNTSATAATSLGIVTISATYGGTVNIDGRYIRLIPYNTGSGTLPVLNSTVTQGSASGKLMCVYSSLTAVPVTTGAIPASGWIMIKAWNSVEYTTGALTLSGITANCTGSSIVGFLEIFGDDASTINANRLGTFNVTGAWYEVGTTNGLSNQTMQIPNNGTLKHFGGVFIEKVAPQASTYTWVADVVTVTLASHGYIVNQKVDIVFTSGSGTPNSEYTIVSVPTTGTFTFALSGSGTGGNCTVTSFEFYPNAGITTTTGTEETRGKVVWIDNTGLVRIGNSGAATNGYTPVSGLKVCIGNVFLQCCLATARNAEVIPNATIATRYDFTSSGGGVVNIDKCSSAWYLSFAQPYSVTLTNVGGIDALLLTECATEITWSKVGIGNKPTTAFNSTTAPLSITLCYAGGTLTDCVWARVAQGTAAYNTTTLTDIYGFTFIRNTFRANTIRAIATAYAINATRVVNTTWTNPKIIQGSIYMTTCNGITVTDEIYCDCVSGTTVITYAMYVWNMLSNTINCIFSGLTFPIANTHPYTAIMNVGVAGCANIKLRNIGTYVSPLTCGSVSIMGNVINLVASAAATDFKVQRVYVANTRVNGIYYISTTSPDNSSTRMIFENVFTDYADASDLNNMLNLTRKGIGGIPALTAATSIYGTHFVDCHTSTTAGRLIFLMNETTSLTSAQVTLTGGANFTSTGGLYMPTIGQTATFTMPYYIIGHTGFSNTAGVMAGGTATNYSYRYQIDKNDGNGFSAWSAVKTATTLGTALNGETGIDATVGFKLKLEITTGTTNTTAITSFYLVTTSTTTTQAYQYPLEVVTVKITAKDAADFSVIENARIYLEADVGGDLPVGTVIMNTLTNSSGIAEDTNFAYTSNQPVIGRSRKGTTTPFYKTSPLSGTITSAGFDLTSFMVSDE